MSKESQRILTKWMQWIVVLGCLALLFLFIGFSIYEYLDAQIEEYNQAVAEISFLEHERMHVEMERDFISIPKEKLPPELQEKREAHERIYMISRIRFNDRARALSATIRAKGYDKQNPYGDPLNPDISLFPEP